MSGSSQTLQDACLGQDHGAGAYGHERSLFAGICLLELCECLDELDGLGFGFEYVVDAVAAGDDEHVVVFEVVVGGLEVDVGFDC